MEVEIAREVHVGRCQIVVIRTWVIIMLLVRLVVRSILSITVMRMAMMVISSIAVEAAIITVRATIFC